MRESMDQTFFLLLRWFFRRFKIDDLSAQNIKRQEISFNVSNLQQTFIPFMLQHKHILLVHKDKFYPIRLNHGFYAPGFPLRAIERYRDNVLVAEERFEELEDSKDYVSSYVRFMRQRLIDYNSFLRPFDSLGDSEALFYISMIFFVPRMLNHSNMETLFMGFSWPQYFSTEVEYFSQNSKGQTTAKQKKVFMLCDFENSKEKMSTHLKTIFPSFEGRARCQISYQGMKLPFMAL